MDGILLINKDKGCTSRDVVNMACKKLNTRKIGHTGTLDPIADGLLILCVGKATKLIDMLTSKTKEYIATVKMGVSTDTYDTEGKVLEEKDFSLDEERLIQALNSFKKTYSQQVPIYSAVKINGMKLYDYARNSIPVELPSRMVTISDIELIDYDSINKHFKFRVVVSKGTYIRSLIHDIGESLNIPMIMSSLTRTKIDNYNIIDSTKIDYVNENSIIKIEDFLNIRKENVDEFLFNKIKNGNKLENRYNLMNDEYIMFIHDSNLVAIYKNVDNVLKAYIVF